MSPPAIEEPRWPIDLAVVGHVNVDHLLEVERLPATDRTVPVASWRTVLGGTAANLARVAASLGVRTALISRVGPDLPAGFRESLDRAHVDLRGLETVRDARSSSCLIVHDRAGGQVTLIDQGAMAHARRAPLPLAVLRESAWVHLGTGDPEYLVRLADAARSAGRPRAVDPAQEIHYRWRARAFRNYLETAEILFGNEHEMARAAQLAGAGSVGGLVDRVPLVVVTRGARGARAYTAGHRVDVAAPRVPGVSDPTGAGDAFRGGFYAGWFAGEPLSGCLGAGVRSAARWLAGRPASKAAAGKRRSR